MKRIKKINIFILALVTVFLVQTEPVLISASDSATFYVQTGVALGEDTIEISVYLNGADNLGGVDVELLYDPQKVTFISSSLGPSLTSSYSDINHDASNANIHYIVLYPESKDAHGILMSVTFKLKEGNSYQPELKVNDLVDNTDEINDIPYTITYQQEDGTWSDLQDTSAILADDSVVTTTLEQHGSPEDINRIDIVSTDTVTVDSDNNIHGVLTDVEIESETTEDTVIGKGDSKVKSDEINQSASNMESSKKYMVITMVVIVIVGIMISMVMHLKRNKRQK